jgi:zinc and cadmium transporter
MVVWVYTLTSVILVSALSLVGIFTLSLNKNRLQKILLYLVSFAAGGLFGDALIHLLPESFERLGAKLSTSLYIVSGILVFFILEKFVRWRHCHVPTDQSHLHPVVTMNLLGDGLHNLIDGMIIGATYMVSIPLGISTTLAVVLHEIPQEIGDFGVLVYGGLSTAKALAFNLLTASVSIAGALISLCVGPLLGDYAVTLLPITAGGFLYIAGSDLVPELQQECEVNVSSAVLQFICLILGIGVMALLVFLE